MSRFRKKPVEIEAFQWHRVDGETGPVKSRGRDTNYNHEYFGIATLEGWINVSDGDWIIRGVKGEFYPCKPEIFEATYEAAA